MSGRRGGRRLAWVHFLAMGLATAFAAEGAGAAPPLSPPRIFVFGTELPQTMEYRLVVEQDVDMPDMALLTLTGSATRRFAARVRIGDPMSVTSPDTPAASVFTGEVVAIEPVHDATGPRVVLRALNRLHRLAGEPRTRTFADVTDAEIVETLAGEHGLVAAAGVELQERHEAVYQHNQTDLEFLRERAARIGYEVRVEGTKLLFRDPENPPPVVLGRPGARGRTPLKRFHPRLSSSETVQKVVVRGWDPTRGAPVVGQAAAETILLTPGEDPDLVFGRTVEFTVDHPIFSVSEANAIAKARLETFLMSYVTAEAEAQGHAGLKPGIVVAVKGSAAPFDGKYYIRGTLHRYTHSPSCGAGYVTLMKLRRESEGLFFLPEIDDEVLVAFAHGDLAQPYVVGSLWGSDGDGCSTDRPPDEAAAAR